MRANHARAVRHRGSAAFLGVLIASIALSTVARAASPLAPGQQLAERLCARCHAVGTSGQSPHPSAPPFRNFASQWPVGSIAEALAEGISVGHPDMPPFELRPAEIDALIAYLETLAP